MRIIVKLAGWLLLGSATTANASGFFGADQEWLRADVQYLVDAGVLHLGVSTWPMAIDEIHAAVASVGDRALEPSEAAALGRLEHTLDTYDTPDDDEVTASVSVHPTRFRQNESIPREDASIGLVMGRDFGRFTAHLSASLNSRPAQQAIPPVDRQMFHPDGSYLSLATGNWIWSAGYIPRSWGPSQNDSLILSTNARPMPAVSLDRLSAMPPSWKLFHWVGPWRFNIFLGRMDGERADIQKPLFAGVRFSFKPLHGLELGLTRTSQVCGKGRRCNFHTLKDWLLGNTNTNTSANITSANDPGNDMAGFDLRWNMRVFHQPIALYAQMIGEDQQGGIPFKYLGEGGLETSFDFHSGAVLRANVEYANTKCSFSTSKPIDRCAYRHYLFNQDGYRYRGFIVGSDWEGDAQVTSVKLDWVQPGGQTLRLRARHGQLHRNAITDPFNVAAPTRRDLDGADFEWLFDTGEWGAFRTGLGVDKLRDPAAGHTTQVGRWYLQWSHRI